MDYLYLRSRPASTGSRIFFSFASCIELFVSDTSQSLLYEFFIPPPPPQQIFAYSILTLRLHRPPSVRLIDTSSSRASTPSAGTASRTSSPPLPSSAISTSTSTNSSTAPSFSHHPEHLDSLSLSTAPPPLRTWHSTSPVFGHPSLPLRPPIFPPSGARQQQQEEEEDDNAMDWTPTASPVRLPGHAVVGVQQRPQTNAAAPAASDATTGLETLLERTNIDSSEPSYGAGGAGRRRQTTQMGLSWGWVYALSLVPLIGVVYYAVLGAGFFTLS